MPGKLNLKIADFGGECSTLNVHTQDFTAINFDANDTLIDNFITALVPVTEGLVVKTTRTYRDLGTGVGKAGSATAQRENKWLLTYQDTVTLKNYQREIPCPLLTAGPTGTILPDIGGNANLVSADWVAFIAAWEALVLSEDGNAVSVVGVRHVGRNN